MGFAEKLILAQLFRFYVFSGVGYKGRGFCFATTRMDPRKINA
jgi:hypothetical protein